MIISLTPKQKRIGTEPLRVAVHTCTHGTPKMGTAKEFPLRMGVVRFHVNLQESIPMVNNIDKQ